MIAGDVVTAVESTAGEHIVRIYRYREVFSRHHIYHFEDFTCVPPVSINGGKTYQKSPAHSSVFRGFFLSSKCAWQIFNTGYTIISPPYLSKIREKCLKKVLRRISVFSVAQVRQ
jgi:hypothetical protein